MATHCHQDHTGGALEFPTAERYIHAADLGQLPPDLCDTFAPVAENRLPNLESVHLGWHTPGSIALFHRTSGTLFCGDHLGFYHLPPEGVVGFGKEIRERARQRVKQWAADPGERHADRLDQWVDGLRALRAYPTRALCPGHGGVLVGAIPEFLNRLIEAACGRD